MQKISGALGDKFGYNMKWSIYCLQYNMTNLVKNSLKKLVKAVEQQGNGKIVLLFSYSTENAQLLMNCETACELKIQLFDFYLKRNTSLNEIVELTKSVNKFFIN